MTTAAAGSFADQHISAGLVVRDALAVSRRNIITFVRVPTNLVFMTMQPVIFVLMFRYVFGGSIQIPGVRYVDYLMAGIFVQTICFGAQNTAIGLATDLQTGIIERFRSLPMARSAVLAGRVGADLVRGSIVTTLMIVMGFLVGFRVHTGPIPFIAAIGLLLVFTLAMSWIMAFVALATGSPEAAQAASFPFMALLVFASNSFVLPDRMPAFLRTYANHQPISANVDAVRSLVLGGPTGSKVVIALCWNVGLIVVFSALAIARYRRAA